MVFLEQHFNFTIVSDFLVHPNNSSTCEWTKPYKGKCTQVRGRNIFMTRPESLKRDISLKWKDYLYFTFIYKVVQLVTLWYKRIILCMGSETTKVPHSKENPTTFRKLR